MQKIVLTITIIFFGYSPFAQNTKQFVEDYLAVKDALIAGDSKAASQAVGIFQQSLKEDEDFAQKNELLKAVNNLAKVSGLEKQRTAFNDVSTNLWKVVKGSDKVDKPVYYQYCPMKKSYWLSEEEEVKNPYYGSAMLACGKVVETK